MSSKRENKEPYREPALEADVAAALAALRWRVPTCEAEVAAAERAATRPLTLPARLGDPQAVLAAGELRPDSVNLLPPISGEIDATLRRAAREGGTIPPETEQKMRRDRQAAEKAAEEAAREAPGEPGRTPGGEAGEKGDGEDSA
jgi:hypothetical protein